MPLVSLTASTTTRTIIHVFTPRCVPRTARGAYVGCSDVPLRATSGNIERQMESHPLLVSSRRTHAGHSILGVAAEVGRAPSPNASTSDRLASFSQRLNHSPRKRDRSAQHANCVTPSSLQQLYQSIRNAGSNPRRAARRYEADEAEFAALTYCATACAAGPPRRRTSSSESSPAALLTGRSHPRTCRAHPFQAQAPIPLPSIARYSQIHGFQLLCQSNHQPTIPSGPAKNAL